MNDEFEKRSRELLEESVSRLDGRTRSRLTQARHAALAQLAAPSKSGSRWLRAYAPAGAAAAVAVLAVVLWAGRPATEIVTAQAAPLDDMDILADAEAPDFVEDAVDVEFYEWAADEIET